MKKPQCWNINIKISFAENSLNSSFSSKTRYCSALLKQKWDPVQQHWFDQNKITTTLYDFRTPKNWFAISFGETIKSVIDFIVAFETWTKLSQFPSAGMKLEATFERCWGIPGASPTLHKCSHEFLWKSVHIYVCIYMYTCIHAYIHTQK